MVMAHHAEVTFKERKFHLFLFKKRAPWSNFSFFLHASYLLFSLLNTGYISLRGSNSAEVNMVFQCTLLHVISNFFSK